MRWAQLGACISELKFSRHWVPGLQAAADRQAVGVQADPAWQQLACFLCCILRPWPSHLQLQAHVLSPADMPDLPPECYKSLAVGQQAVSKGRQGSSALNKVQVCCRGDRPWGVGGVGVGVS